MAETVKLTRAEVTKFGKNDNTILRERKIEDKGTVFTFKVQTHVNDRVENSPRLFRRCSYFAKTEEEVTKVKNLVSEGALLEVEGLTNRKNFEDKETKQKIYYDEVDVRDLAAIQTGQDSTPSARDDLPF